MGGQFHNKYSDNVLITEVRNYNSGKSSLCFSTWTGRLRITCF